MLLVAFFLMVKNMSLLVEPFATVFLMCRLKAQDGIPQNQKHYVYIPAVW